MARQGPSEARPTNKDAPFRVAFCLEDFELTLNYNYDYRPRAVGGPAWGFGRAVTL